MTFQRAGPNPAYPALRFLSDSGRWELGFSRFRGGIRLRMGLCGRPPSVIDFCLGHNSAIYSLVLLSVIKRLEPIPESATPQEIDAAFPWAGTRPDMNAHLKTLIGKLS
ncbi:MAG: hypothetical protein WC076_03095 [Terrimicrobiaceae bacterium]|nr:hypothetical protein [Terrimicrobiaceae bacterium]